MTNKIHIFHVLPNLEVGGAEVVTINMIKVLREMEYDVTLVSLYQPSSQSLIWMVRDMAIPLYTLNKRIGFDPKVANQLARILHEAQPDIVHTHLRALKYTFLALIRNPHTPWIHTVHNIAERENSWAERQLFRYLCQTRRVIPVAVSEFVQDSFFRYYNLKQCNVIHNGIPTTAAYSKSMSVQKLRSTMDIPEQNVVVLAVGRITQQKNPLLLLRAFNRMKQKIKASTLVYAGDGPMRNELVAQVENLGIADSVRILGHVKNIPPLMRASDIFVLPSDWEGLPLSLLEAMNNALPTIATSVGGVPEAIDSNATGYLVKPGDEDGITRLLIRLALDNRLRKKIGQRARAEVARKFSIERMAHSYAGLYNERFQG